MKRSNRTIIPQGIRFDVFRRDNFACIYCGRQSPDVILECDHKIAVANGGTNETSNLVTSCYDCNRGKGSKEVSNIPSPQPVNYSVQHPLAGKFGHSLRTYESTGELLRHDWQFMILGVSDGIAFLKLYSWLDGRETNIYGIPLLELIDREKFKLYATEDEWRQSSEAMERSVKATEDRLAYQAKLEEETAFE